MQFVYTKGMIQGKIHPTIDKVFSLSDAKLAFERSLNHQGSGKIVFEIN